MSSLQAYIMYPTEMSRLNDLSTEKKKLSSVLQARATSLSEDQKAKIVVRLAEIEDNMAHSASFDSARYQPNPPGKGKTSEPEEWRAAVDNASAQVANQGHRCANKIEIVMCCSLVFLHRCFLCVRIVYSDQAWSPNHRMDVLELVGTYSTRAWKKHLLDLERLEIEAKRTLKKVRDQVQEVNWQRKTDHTAAGSDIWNLQTKWGVLVSKNYDIERLNQALVDEITVLQQQECG